MKSTAAYVADGGGPDWGKDCEKMENWVDVSCMAQMRKWEGEQMALASLISLI